MTTQLRFAPYVIDAAGRWRLVHSILSRALSSSVTRREAKDRWVPRMDHLASWNDMMILEGALSTAFQLSEIPVQ